MRDNPELERTIERLLSDPQYDDHPLRRALADLYAEFRDALYQIERIARISDRYQSMMRDLNEALKDASTRDALTGIGNRRMLMDRLKAETARAERMDRPLTVAIADVDRFKAINDAYGHEAGDKALVEIAATIEASVREYDVCGRWGGEEFLIVMPEIGAADAALVVERVRSAIDALQISFGDDRASVSASFGIAERQPGESASKIVSRADTALFSAKRAGRNRVEIA